MILQSALAFLLALGPLVVVHELGHYWVARWCGVKVLRFSVGLGQVLWSRKIGPDQTEWAISMLPLGGYVKMLDARDQDVQNLPPAELAREFTRQNVWKRIAIVAAGPIANFIMAIVLLTGLYMVGVPEPVALLRAVLVQTPAHQAGLLGGDKVLAVNGKAVAGWPEMRWEVMQAIIRQSGDASLLISRAGNPGAPAQTMTIRLPLGNLTVKDLDGDFMAKLGLELKRPPAVVLRAIEKGAAERAGMSAGDRIETINGRVLVDSLDLLKTIQASPGQRLVLGGVDKQGHTFSRSVEVEAVKPSPSVTARLRSALFGNRPEAADKSEPPVGRIQVELNSIPEMLIVRQSLFGGLSQACARTWDLSAMTVKLFGKMVVGEASLKNITGPITIADYAGQSARLGLASFLGFVALISISLGVMNLLPIPVLDGGFLLYYSLEVLMGRPLPERISDIAQRVGLGLLVMLMVLAVMNDVIRLIP